MKDTKGKPVSGDAISQHKKLAMGKMPSGSGGKPSPKTKA